MFTEGKYNVKEEKDLLLQNGDAMSRMTNNFKQLQNSDKKIQDLLFL